MCCRSRADLIEYQERGPCSLSSERPERRQIPTGGDIPEMKARVTITLKPGVLDPQGKALEHALARLGFPGVETARAGTGYELGVADGTSDDHRSGSGRVGTEVVGTVSHRWVTDT